MFEGVNTDAILDAVPASLPGEVERSLWRRIRSEYTSGGPTAVPSYLRAQFDLIATRLSSELEVTEDPE